MYDASDPRARLTTTPVSALAEERFFPAEFVKFYEIDPRNEDLACRSWYARGQNFLVVLSETAVGARLHRKGQPDEYMLLLERPQTAVRVSAKGEHIEVPGRSLVIVPPGDSVIDVPGGGRLVRIFSTRSPDLVSRCVNASSYAEPRSRIPPFEPWPEPTGGYRIRWYSLDVPAEEGRFGAIWRCTNLMVNVLGPIVGPRDSSRLSPHHHDDFEQGSLALQGSFMHHLRWPWTRDMAAWREDRHERCNSPSLCVIPPPAIHTTRWLDPDEHQLVDIFSPPRLDFSLQKDWVLNADEYPMPARPTPEA